jgi:membrane protein required for colicin V production
MILLASLLAEKFSILDIVVLFIIGWGGYKGFHKGFLVELISIFTFILLLVLIFWIVSLIFQLSADRIGFAPPKAGAFITFVLLYAVIALGVSWFDKIVKGKLSLEIFEGLDSFVGLIFGVIKYAFGLSIGLELVVSAGITSRSELMNNAITYAYLNGLFNYMLDIGRALAPSVAELVQNIRYLLR